MKTTLFIISLLAVLFASNVVEADVTRGRKLRARQGRGLKSSMSMSTSMSMSSMSSMSTMSSMSMMSSSMSMSSMTMSSMSMSTMSSMSMSSTMSSMSSMSMMGRIAVPPKKQEQEKPKRHIKDTDRRKRRRVRV
ncbi:expressed unknown protein [Seminavis robusta]|uniref:Uncharacterized protein n=1 Tax=Seminavis robusta TaxID=568900 RepID=A0A9N8DZT1_9STRA|nr:expressed unknown protein [Seminavis robusta]|eukprot:Sro423_g139770.1 n/a (135) ;mRNA; f:25165-25912